MSSSLPPNGHRVLLSPGLSRQGREADHSRKSSADIKNVRAIPPLQPLQSPNRTGNEPKPKGQ